MSQVLTVTSPVFILIALGFVAVRSGFLSKDELRVLGKFVLCFALPALLFRALAGRRFDELLDTRYLVAYALGSLVALAVGVLNARRRLGKDMALSALHGMGMACSNSGYVGFPIVSQLLGPPATVAFALTLMVENLLILPLGLALAEGRDQGGKGLVRLVGGILLRVLRSPLVIAIVAGLGFSILELRLPGPADLAIHMLAQAAAPVALFVVGGTLVGLRVKGMRRKLAQVVAGKLLLHPLLVFLGVLALPPADPALATAAVAFAAMPMMGIYPILAQKYGHEEFCAATLMVTTVLSFFSISAVLTLLRLWQG